MNASDVVASASCGSKRSASSAARLANRRGSSGAMPLKTGTLECDVAVGEAGPGISVVW